MVIFIILIGLLYIAVLELSKNMLIGWAVGILATVAMLLYRGVFYKKIGSRRNTLLAFLAFAIILAANLFLTKPPVKRVPAVDNKNPDVTETIEIDQAIVAVGVSPNPIVPTSIEGLELGRKNTIVVNEGMQTNIPTIFAGGDIVRGGATVILAMGDGRRAAKAMDEYLSKK